MKTFLHIVITSAITWAVVTLIHGARTGAERLWLVSAIKAPGRMALQEIQADLNAERHTVAKAKLEILINTWQRFDSGLDSFSGPGIGDVTVAFSRLHTNTTSNLDKSTGSP